MRIGHTILVLVATAAACGPDKKVGGAGSTCSAASDCAGDLQCIASTCVDPAATTAAAASKVSEDLAKTKVKAAQNATLQIQGAGERYLLEKHDSCPKSVADLKAANIIRASELKDPWGEDYLFACPGEHGPVDVTSYGPDRKAGGGDDINSWEKPV